MILHPLSVCQSLRISGDFWDSDQSPEDKERSVWYSNIARKEPNHTLLWEEDLESDFSPSSTFLVSLGPASWYVPTHTEGSSPPSHHWHTGPAVLETLSQTYPETVFHHLCKLSPLTKAFSLLSLHKTPGHYYYSRCSFGVLIFIRPINSWLSWSCPPPYSLHLVTLLSPVFSTRCFPAALFLPSHLFSRHSSPVLFFSFLPFIPWYPHLVPCCSSSNLYPGCSLHPSFTA